MTNLNEQRAALIERRVVTMFAEAVARHREYGAAVWGAQWALDRAYAASLQLPDGHPWVDRARQLYGAIDSAWMLVSLQALKARP